MADLGRTLQFIGLVIVPAALLRPEPMEMFGILMVGAGIFLVGNHFVKRA